MRTVHRLEAKDIQEDNKVHTALMAGITLSLLILKGSTKETIMADMKEAIAGLLNILTDMDIDIVDREQVPEVFKREFPNVD